MKIVARVKTGIALLAHHGFWSGPIYSNISTVVLDALCPHVDWGGNRGSSGAHVSLAPSLKWHVCIVMLETYNYSGIQWNLYNADTIGAI